MPEGTNAAEGAPIIDAPSLNLAKTFTEFEEMRTKPAGAKTDKSEKPSAAASDDKGEKKAETAGDSEAPNKETQEKPKESEPKRESGLERRFAKLTRTIKEKEGKIASLEARLDALVSAKPKEPESKAVIKADDGRPRMPRIAQFETQEEYEAAMEKYNEDLSDWKADRREEKRQKDEQERRAREEQEKIAKTWDSRLKDVRKAYPDYDEVLEAAETEEVSITSIMFGAMQDSEYGAHIGYQLMKDPDEAERIAGLSPLAQVRAIGKIEDRIERELKAKSPAKENKPKVSNAPEPIRTVSSTKGAKNTDLNDPETPWEEWEERRAAVDKRR